MPTFWNALTISTTFPFRLQATRIAAIGLRTLEVLSLIRSILGCKCLCPSSTDSEARKDSLDRTYVV